MPTINELVHIRTDALNRHRQWKQRSLTSDLIVQGRWQAIWPDLTVEENEPTVENIYIEALEDKAAAAGAGIPFVDVAPTRGTREDRAERVAQQRRRAFISFMRDSDLYGEQVQWYMDWLQHGAMFGMPWTLPDEPWYPFAIRLDPRFVYPIAHDSRGRLSAALFIRNRTAADIASDFPNNETVNRRIPKWREENLDLEEIWYLDKNEWGVAISTAGTDGMGSFRYVSPTQKEPSLNPSAEWIIEPHPHRLSHCPLVERRKVTGDGEYRGALDPMIPQLKHAHNLMSQLLLDVSRNVFAPILVDGVENPEDIGPEAILLGDGTGASRIEYPRPPMNFEAMQQVAAQIVAARNVGAFPQQRSGDFGASIASAKGVSAVMGQYNTQQAWAQRDLSVFYSELLSRLAEYDEQWCGGYRKEIRGYDEGEMFTDKYDPAKFWKGDYRVHVGFHGEGLDKQAHTTYLAMIRNMGGMSMRSFMRLSGAVDNPLQEEREQALEQRDMAFMSFVMQQAQAGNMEPLRRFSELVDGDTETARSAISKVIAEMFAVPTEGPAAGMPGMGGTGNPGDVVEAARSLASGGIPGNAEGQRPLIGGDLAGLLPAGLGRAAAEQAPGGTAA